MPNSKSRQAAANFPPKHAMDSNAAIVVVGEYVTKAGDVINDIVEMVGLPRDCVPVDVIVDNGALGASATLDVGILSGEYGDAVAGRTMPATDFVAAGAAATAGVIRRNRSASGLVVQNVDRSVGIRFLGANPAAGQTIRLTLICAPNPGALVAV
jgi:hypothetical protein